MTKPRRFALDPGTQQASLFAEPRDFYVTMLRGPRVAWLVGPLDTHAAALAKVQDAKREASRIDPWSDFDLFGTASLPRAPGNPVGKLNYELSKLHVDNHYIGAKVVTTKRATQDDGYDHPDPRRRRF